VSDFEKVTTLLRDLKDLGVKLSIDDFGTGYCSLHYLNRLPVDVIKIDRSLIAPMFQRASSIRLIKNVIRLGRDLGLEVVAEGVEQLSQMETLQELGCNTIQGYYCSRPMASFDFETYMDLNYKHWNPQHYAIQ